jgi:dTDP-4-dehydrorhamnose reductase
MTIAVIGYKGMVGHMVFEILKRAGYDVAGYGKTSSIIAVGDVIVNCAGILNDACDEDIETALQTNAILPWKLHKRCKHLIQISTDCVFDGSRDGRKVGERPDATTLYGKSKALGEVDRPNVIVLRQSIMGPSPRQSDRSLLKWALEWQKPTIPGFSNWTWNGVTNLELAKKIASIIKTLESGRNISGLYHYVTEQPIIKGDLLRLIGETWNCPWEVVVTESPEPRLMVLEPDGRIKPPPPIKSQLQALKAWMQENEYPIGRPQ